MSLARQLRTRLACWQGGWSRLLSSQATAQQAGGMPEFFANADLSQATSNIGLARRRDLTFRRDILLAVGGESRTLKELFKGEKVVVFGVPDCGKVCSETHLPGYLAELDALRRLGVSKVLCVAVGEPAAAQRWAEQLRVDPSQIQVAADPNGSWTRYLGLELDTPGEAGAKSLRYSAVVDDGVLLKLKVDADPAKCEQSSAASMVQLLKGHPH